MDSQPQSNCSDWHAWHTRTPKPTLHVAGKCRFPTAGFKVELRRQEPQGINPRILLLEKIVRAPSGPVGQVVTVERVKYSEPATSTQFTHVTILPDGVTIPVEDASAVLPAAMFRQWVHSREEDTGDVEVYRPRGFSFPPSFGRDGFEMKRNGEFIQNDIGPADGVVQVAGRWELRDVDEVAVSFRNPDREDYAFMIVAVNDTILRITRRAAQTSYGQAARSASA
jgi:hypothetical protein